MLHHLYVLLVGLANRLFSVTTPVVAIDDDLAGFESEDAMWEDLDANMEGDYEAEMSDAMFYVQGSYGWVSLEDISGVMLPGVVPTDDHYTYVSLYDGDVLRLDNPVNSYRDDDWVIMDDGVVSDAVILIDNHSRIHITVHGMTTVYADAVSILS